MVRQSRYAGARSELAGDGDLHPVCRPGRRRYGGDAVGDLREEGIMENEWTKENDRLREEELCVNCRLYETRQCWERKQSRRDPGALDWCAGWRTKP